MCQVNKRGSVTTVRVDTALDAMQWETVENRLAEHLRTGVPEVIFDLTEVPLIDSAGLEGLIRLDRTCSARGGRVSLCGAGELCSDILRITGVMDRIETFETLTAALATATS